MVKSQLSWFVNLAGARLRRWLSNSRPPMFLYLCFRHNLSLYTLLISPAMIFWQIINSIEAAQARSITRTGWPLQYSKLPLQVYSWDRA